MGMTAQPSDVLVVDDTPTVAEAIADGVRLAGHIVCGVATTVEQAIGACPAQ